MTSLHRPADTYRQAVALATSAVVLATVLASGLLCVQPAIGAPATGRASIASGAPEPTATPSPSISATRAIGFSVRGRPIVVESFGSGARRILVVAGIHGDEYGIPVAERFSAYLRKNPSVIASGTQVDVIVCANPDGRALKRRTNGRGVDLNRNFPSRNWSRRWPSRYVSPGKSPGSEPETKALVALLGDQRYVSVVSLHSALGVIDYDGKGGFTLAHRIAKASKYRVRRLSTRRGYPGSMGSYVPERFRIPVVTWELSKPYFTAPIRDGLLAALK